MFAIYYIKESTQMSFNIIISNKMIQQTLDYYGNYNFGFSSKLGISLDTFEFERNNPYEKEIVASKLPEM